MAHTIMEDSTASTDVCLSSEHDDFQWVDCSEIGSIDMCDQFHPFFEVYCGKVEEQENTTCEIRPGLRSG